MTTSATRAEAPGKGLAAGKLGLLPSTVIGLGSTAPLYSLAATLGFIVMAAGAQAPMALIAAFVPMCLTAFAYRELSTDVPDAGTAFTWAAKAFGPRTGWFAGWGVFVAGVIVMASQTEVASRTCCCCSGTAPSRSPRSSSPRSARSSASAGRSATRGAPACSVWRTRSAWASRSSSSRSASAGRPAR